jgi:23S rRNA pseudouridine1911/1915/1917 synthase
MPLRTERITVEKSLPGRRLDTFLRSRFPDTSRSALQRLIEEGNVRVDGRTVRPTHSPRAGEQIEVHWPEAKPAVAQPEEIPLAILYEDEHLLVLDKPPGSVVHPAAGHEEHTLVNALLHHCAGQLSGIGGVARPGIVHRLDKETSGCLVVAKTDPVHLALSAQFASRKVEKIYHALVCGEMLRDRGEIRAEIARHPTHRKRMAVRDGSGREARTSYRVRERLGGATLVEVLLHTGRTHQIRVHFHHIGYPIVGDLTYGRRQNARLAELSGYAAPRHMLHARALSFIHPHSGQWVSFESPWPEDFEDALAALRPR